MNNQNTKLFLPIAVFICLLFSGCKKEDNPNNSNDPGYMSNAEIIGNDLRTCPCCGGYEITIDNTTPPAGSTFFLISSLPSTYTIPTNPTYPILVKIDYTVDPSVCSGGFVKITRIADR